MLVIYILYILVTKTTVKIRVFSYESVISYVLIPNFTSYLLLTWKATIEAPIYISILEISGQIKKC